MSVRPVVLIVTVATVGWVAAAHSQTPHFTFNIPVQLNSMAPNTRASVTCNVYTNAGRTVEVGGGTGFLQPIDADGNASETLVVGVNARPGKDPATATYYECVMQLEVNDDQCWRAGESGSGPGCFAKPDTELVNTVRGPIP